MLNAVSPQDLIHFSPGGGDLAGAIFNSRLQENTHFPDLRDYSIGKDVVTSLRQHISKDSPLPSIDRMGALRSVATERFGSTFVERILAPTLSRFYGLPFGDLAGFAMLLPGWTRVVLDDHTNWESNLDNERYRAIVAVPDQRNLPKELHHGRRSFYSRSFGSRDFIEGIKKDLEARDVQFLCNASILDVNLDQRSLTLFDEKKEKIVIVADFMIIATGVLGAATLLQNDLKTLELDQPLPHTLINVVLESPCPSDLCFLYGLDDDCEWYRVTNYKAITGRSDDRRLTIEVLGPLKTDNRQSPLDIVRQLNRFGFLDSDSVLFSDVVMLANGFPAPTVSNLNKLTALGSRLTANLPPRVLMGGIGFGGGLFFQNEVVSHLYAKVLDLA
jgi:oxygen-dependent protoporphyrinogen oxidase